MKLRAFILDMDGVLYRGHHAVKGVPQAIAMLRKKGIKLFFLTNNATRTRATLAKKLRQMGIASFKSEIGTSAYAAAKFIASKSAHAKVFVFGERGLKDEMKSAGLHAVGIGGKPSFLVSGLDRHATYAKMRDACLVLRKNTFWVACNMDRTLPMHGGEFWPGSGSLASALSYASSRQPGIIVGKPNPEMIKPIISCCAKQGIKKSEIALVGDRLDIDVALASRAGIVPILVLTGVATAKDAKKAKGEEKPELIIRSAAELPKLLR